MKTMTTLIAMCKCVLLVLLSLGALFSCRNGSGERNVRELVCSQMVGDGIDWNAADSLVFLPSEGEGDNRTVVKTCWDADSLYVLFKVRDADLIALQRENDHKKLYLDDMVEVLIDTDNDKSAFWHEDDIVYHINILGYKKDDRGTPEHQSDASWNGEADYVIDISGSVNDSSDEDEGYMVRVAFPWPELGRTPYPGLRLGVNFANGDNDGCGRQLYNWCRSDPMRSPDTFGTLVLR